MTRAATGSDCGQRRLSLSWTYSVTVSSTLGSTPLVLAHLPRRWWFSSIEGYRGHGGDTYGPVDLDSLPVPPNQDPSLTWLAAEPEREWSIGFDEGHPDARRPLDSAGLAEVVPASLRPPQILSELAGRPELQQRIRSSTGCYLDLGDFSVPTTAPGGHVIHLLSDQQWAIHWMVYLDCDGGEAVLVTPAPFGFEPLGQDTDPPLPERVPLDGSIQLEVCADSVMEFIARLWVENELCFGVLGEDAALAPEVAAYAAGL